jgi:hypothetical protein
MQERKTEEARESVYPARIAIFQAHPVAQQQVDNVGDSSPSGQELAVRRDKRKARL